MSRYISLSYVLSPALSCYNNQRNVDVVPYKNNECEIRLRGHVGTHLDVPYHVTRDGKKITDYSIEDFIYRRVAILHPRPSGCYIEPSDLGEIPSDVEFLLLETGAWRHRRDASYTLRNTGLGAQTASYLSKNFPKLRAIGIDCISINAFEDKQSGRDAHRVLLGRESEILIVEDMDLSTLGDAQIELLVVAPLVVENNDSAPCQVVARLKEP